jgi:hypothetical protein
MNTTSHPVAPEEIMALLDGELPEAEAHAVSAHLAACSECAELAGQFRSTSQWLARWEVEPVPARVEAFVEELATPRKPVLSWPWSWKLWAAGGGLLAAASIAVALVTSSFSAHKVASRQQFAELEAPAAASVGHRDRFSGGGLEQLGKGPDIEVNSSKQFERLDRAAKLMAPPVMPPPPMRQAASSAVMMPPTMPPNAKSKGSIAATAPMIAHTVSMVVVVKDFAASRATLDAILLRHHGYSAQLNVTTPENGARAFNASLRIPAPELAAALAECKSLGRVENETQSGEEVTQQHADLLARLHNARETEERLRAILAQRTGKVSDVLEVEESIARVRGEIEQMEAEQQTLEHRVDFATVDIQLTEQYKASLDTPADSVATRLQNAAVAGYRNASETVLGIILFLAEYGPSLLIWLLILGTPAWLLWRRRRRAERKLPNA